VRGDVFKIRERIYFGVGLAQADTVARELESREKKLPVAADALMDDITHGFEALIGQSPDPAAVRAVQGGELMLLRAIRKIVIHDMLERVKKA
jgi:serine/threonine-protein kinase HipA